MPSTCGWADLKSACRDFVTTTGTQSGWHIKQLHYYVACRLVIEGGFLPEHTTPRPPFSVTRKRKQLLLAYTPEIATGSEATVFGGLKTKSIDVVINLPALGPCFAVSVKGTLNAYRNLTNRLEEAVGDCTNIHIAYPSLVFGFLHVLRANRAGPKPPHSLCLKKEHPKRAGHVAPEDVAVADNGEIVSNIFKYAAAVSRLSGRKDLRNDVSRYEAASVMLIEAEAGKEGEFFTGFPDPRSSIAFDSFFATLYNQYDLRFVYGAPDLKYQTRRMEWDAESPAFSNPLAAGFSARIGVEEQLSSDEEGTNPVPPTLVHLIEEPSPPIAE